MLINLESHINMLHTQSDEKWRERGEEEENRKMKGGPSRSEECVDFVSSDTRSYVNNLCLS